MPFLPMPYFMGKNGNNLLVTVRCKKGIKEHDPFGLSQSRKVGVGVPTSFAGIHLKDTPHRQAALMHDALDLLFQCLVFQGKKLVEPGCNYGRVDNEQQELKSKEHEPRPEPPEAPAVFDQKQDQDQQDSTDHGTYQHTL